MARGQWAETAMGGLVLAAAASFLIYALSAGAIHPQGQGYELTAKFGQVGALAPGADVRVSGVKVGTVSAVTLDPKTFLAITHIMLDPTVKLPADSTAKVTSDGLLGGQHIAIEPGGASVDLFGLIGQFLRPASPAAAASAAPASSAASDPYGVPAAQTAR